MSPRTDRRVRGSRPGIFIEIFSRYGPVVIPSDDQMRFPSIEIKSSELKIIEYETVRHQCLNFRLLFDNATPVCVSFRAT